MTFSFAPAKREQVSLLIALAGASGSGKTYSALRLAKGMAPAGKIAFIDTEARRGLHYAEEFDFLHSDMRPPFRPAAFIEGIRAAEAAGAEVVIIDSFSHEYDGQGGIMDWADELAEGTPKPSIANPRPEGSHPDWWKDWAVKPVKSPGNWKEPKGGHKKLMQALLQCRASIIFCLRADEKIAIERKEVDENGRTRMKTVITPLGWMPICEKRFMFEMTASFTLTPDKPGVPHFDLPHKLQRQHRSMFTDAEPIDEDSGRALAAWARGGSAAPLIPDQPQEDGAADYIARWDGIVKGATNADQLAAKWNSEGDERKAIAWPEGQFIALQRKVKVAIDSMRAPA
jgi:hypothetical protein